MLHIEYIKHLSALIDNPVFFAFFLAVLIDGQQENYIQ